jgi:hypothetical protein
MVAIHTTVTLTPAHRDQDEKGSVVNLPGNGGHPVSVSTTTMIGIGLSAIPPLAAVIRRWPDPSSLLGGLADRPGPGCVTGFLQGAVIVRCLAVLADGGDHVADLADLVGEH